MLVENLLKKKWDRRILGIGGTEQIVILCDISYKLEWQAILDSFWSDLVKARK